MLDTGQLPLTGEALLRFRQGLAAAASEEDEQAVFHYDSVVSSRPDFYEAWYERGLALEGCGEYAAAIASFDHAISLNPKNDVLCQIWHERGNTLQYGLGDYVAAISCYDRVLLLCNDHAKAWSNRGNALLYGLKAHEEAIVCYTRALQIDPDDFYSWRNRGNALVELKRYPEAIASYDRALSIKPDDEVSWHARNLAFTTSGLSDRQPTTNPVWYGEGFSTPTVVEAENSPAIHHSEISHPEACISPEISSSPEIPNLLQRQPFLIIEDDWGRREVFLERLQYIIGRDAKSDICLHSQFASRHHAVVTKVFKPDGSFAYQIVDGDLNGKPSTNGLLINGKKFQMREMKPEDVIVFGPRVQAIYRLAPGRSPVQPG